MVRIVHLTSVHPPFDGRIFHKECRALAAAGFDVTLVVPHDRDEERDGVRLVAVRPPRSRRERMSRTVRDVYNAALDLKADIYHFHDPELMPVGVLLKLHCKRVIYDVHEDYGSAMYNKPWLPRLLRPVLSLAVRAVERACTLAYDRVCPATEPIAQHFPARKTHIVQNFPAMAEFTAAAGPPLDTRAPIALYLGAIDEVRGLREMIAATELASVRFPLQLVLAGPTDSSSLAHLSAAQKRGQTNYLGVLDRNRVCNELSRARLGLVVLHPSRSYVVSQPTKLYEYMSAGLPVIASDFPAWREVVKRADCGLLVDPLDPAAISEAMVWLLEHPLEAARMGQNGRRAVLSRYNWEAEAEAFVLMYRDLLYGPVARKGAAA